MRYWKITGTHTSAGVLVLAVLPSWISWCLLLFLHLISSHLLYWIRSARKGDPFRAECTILTFRRLSKWKRTFEIEQDGFIVFLAVQVKQILNKLKTELSNLHSLTLQPWRTTHGRRVEGYLLVLVWTMDHAKGYWRRKGWLNLLLMSLPLQVWVRLYALTLTFSLSDTTISHH